MIDDPPFEPDRALFDRWRAAAAGTRAHAPDALSLAAYAEGRLDDAAAEDIEAALAADPELLGTLLALRQPPAPAMVPAAFVRSAQALVPFPSDAVVVPFRRRGGQGRVNPWLAWGAVAASLLLVSVAGFDLGMRTEHAVSAASAPDGPGDLLDLSNLSDDDIG